MTTKKYVGAANRSLGHQRNFLPDTPYHSERMVQHLWIVAELVQKLLVQRLDDLAEHAGTCAYYWLTGEWARVS